MAKLSNIKSINSFLKAVQELADEEGDSAFGHAARHIASQLKPLLNTISIVSPFLGWKVFHVIRRVGSVTCVSSCCTARRMPSPSWD